MEVSYKLGLCKTLENDLSLAPTLKHLPVKGVKRHLRTRALFPAVTRLRDDVPVRWAAD